MRRGSSVRVPQWLKLGSMSSQRGNVQRSRPQKHKNATVYKNDKYETSSWTKVRGRYDNILIMSDTWLQLFRSSRLQGKL